MYIVRAKRKSDGGFTLLEIMLAVAILAMMSLAIYRFVQSNILALRISSEASAADARYDALRDLLNSQLQNLPTGSGALLGDPLKVSDRSRDEMRWIAGAGPGVLTRYAPGDFTVSLRLQPESKKSDRLDLGLLRKPKGDQSFSDVHESWVPLLTDVRSMQIRYFDPRLNVWLSRWSDTITLPRLVKVVIERNDAAVPWEAIIPLGRTPL
ncbi:MAG: Type secretion system protein [Verrucomicrobiota bacterium]|jgi:prepilin-type N-terminal cleavage/methylation domain-containing protein